MKPPVTELYPDEPVASVRSIAHGILVFMKSGKVYKLESDGSWYNYGALPQTKADENFRSN